MIVQSLNDYLTETYDETMHGTFNRPAAVMVDGFSMHIQAGNRYYSNPGRDLVCGYSSVEVSCPSADEDMLYKYRNYHGLGNKVFAYVPSYIVDRIIQKHGGIILPDPVIEQVKKKLEGKNK